MNFLLRLFVEKGTCTIYCIDIQYNYYWLFVQYFPRIFSLGESEGKRFTFPPNHYLVTSLVVTGQYFLS
jgi:hypothetical protein